MFILNKKEWLFCTDILLIIKKQNTCSSWMKHKSRKTSSHNYFSSPFDRNIITVQKAAKNQCFTIFWIIDCLRIADFPARFWTNRRQFTKVAEHHP